MSAEIVSVQSLLNQIHWLSAELKRRAAAAPEEQKLLLATRGVLQTVAEKDLSVPAVAHIRNTTRQNIQIIANRLAEEGLIEFVTNPRHKKSDLLRLTEKGSAVLHSATAQEAPFVSSLAGHLGKTEVDAAIHCLRHLRSVLGAQISAHQADSSTVVHVKRPARVLPSLQPPPNATSGPGIAERSPVPVAKPYSEEESLPVNLL